MNLLRVLLYIPAKVLLAVAQLLRHTPIFPSFWRSLVASSTIGKASRAYKDGEVEKSFLIYKGIADAQSVKTSMLEASAVSTAQYFTGHMYLNGEGVPADLELAKHYYAKAASLGCKDAEAALSSLREEATQPLCRQPLYGPPTIEERP